MVKHLLIYLADEIVWDFSLAVRDKIRNFIHAEIASLLAAHIKKRERKDPFIEREREREMNAMDDLCALYIYAKRKTTSG